MDSSPLRIRVPSNPRCALFLLKPGAALTRAIRTVSPFSACALQLHCLGWLADKSDFARAGTGIIIEVFQASQHKIAGASGEIKCEWVE